MNIVFISPHFPPNFSNFCSRLREEGATVLGIGDAPYEELSPELRQAVSEYYRSDMQCYDDLLRACGWFTHRHGKIDRVVSHNEFWLETEARLRRDFNIIGHTPEEVAEFTLKSRMKERFREAGVAVAAGRVVTEVDEARALVAETGYPVVAKPNRGVGAAATFKLSSERQLKEFITNKPDIPYIMEGFVNGVLNSFDGLVDRDGKIVFCASHVFSQGIMETVTENQDLFYYSQRLLPPDLEEAGRATVQAFGLRETFFHLEFFRTVPDGRIVGLEVNIRPPGGLTLDMFNYANDIDLYRQWATMLVGGIPTVEYSRPYHCAYAGRKRGKSYRRSHDEILHHLGRLIIHHEQISSIFSAAIGDYGYLLRSPALEELKDAARYIQELQG